MSKLYIIRGIPGSGKSTYADKLEKDLWEEGAEVTHHESDKFFMKDGEYRFDPSKLEEAHKQCFEKTFDSFDKGCDSVIVSNTFTTLWEMQPYLDKAKEKNIEVVVYRMANEFKNVHNVPEETLAKMKARFQDYENEIIVKEG